MTQVFTKLVNYIILLLLNWCYKFTWFLLLLLSSLHTPIKATHIFTCQHWKIWLLCHGRLANLISEPETYKANEHKLNITAHHGFGSSFLHSRCFLSTSPPPTHHPHIHCYVSLMAAQFGEGIECASMAAASFLPFHLSRALSNVYAFCAQ